MTRTISITLEEGLFRRLEEFRRALGHVERSGLVQRALRFYLAEQGPDPRVLRRWAGAYAKVREREAALVGDWSAVQADSLGRPE